jgi:hypothetical protein
MGYHSHRSRKGHHQQSGLRELPYLTFNTNPEPGSYQEPFELPIKGWVDDRTYSYGHAEFDTLIEAQAKVQELKANLARIKQAMETDTSTPTEDSFEL